MEENDLPGVLMGMVKRAVDRIVDSYTQLEKEERSLDGIVDFAASTFVHEDTISKKDLENKSAEETKDYLVVRTQEVFEKRPQQLSSQEQSLGFGKVAILRVINTRWTDHIDAMDQLRQPVGLRTHDQNNPLVEYQTGGYSMYNSMVGSIECEVTRLFMRPEIRQNVQRGQVAQGQTEHPETGQDAATQNNISTKRQSVRIDRKMGRNDLCPYGSDKKFKNCHRRNA